MGFFQTHPGTILECRAWQVGVYRHELIMNGPHSGKVPDFMGKTPGEKAFWAAFWRLKWSKRGKSGFGHIHIETKE